MSTDVLSVVVVVVRQVVTVHVVRNESSSASQPYVVTADMAVRELELAADGERYWFRMICRGGVIAISGSVA